MSTRKSCQSFTVLNVAVASPECKFTVPIGGGDAAVHQKITAGDERALATHQQRTYIAHLIGSTGASCGAHLDHAAVSGAAGAGLLRVGERCDDDSWTDGVDTGNRDSP